jgi:hypothetical protein
VLNDDVRDGGQPGALAAPADELLQGRLGAADGSFDVTFRRIPDPACERKFCGHFFGCEAVGDALDSACYDEMNGWHGMIRWVIAIRAKVRISGKWLKNKQERLKRFAEWQNKGNIYQNSRHDCIDQY